MSGSSYVPAHMLIGMSGSCEQVNRSACLTPAELALIKASLGEARTRVDQLIQRANALTKKVESFLPQSAQGDSCARPARGERHGSS